MGERVLPPVVPKAGEVMRDRIHAIEPRSRANGPGARFVVWLQGCTLGCPGCFNPTTHDAQRRRRAIDRRRSPREIARPTSKGLSLSGGEPLQQAEAAAALLEAARARGLSTLAFSGYTIDEIRALPGGRAVLARLDVLIDGRYVAGERLATGLRGSANQRIHAADRSATRSPRSRRRRSRDPDRTRRRGRAHRRESAQAQALDLAMAELPAPDIMDRTGRLRRLAIGLVAGSIAFAIVYSLTNGLAKPEQSTNYYHARGAYRFVWYFSGAAFVGVGSLVTWILGHHAKRKWQRDRDVPAAKQIS